MRVVLTVLVTVLVLGGVGGGGFLLGRQFPPEKPPESIVYPDGLIIYHEEPGKRSTLTGKITIQLTEHYVMSFATGEPDAVVFIPRERVSYMGPHPR